MEDRKKYGEGYWHRSHQMIGISVCSEHGCDLIECNIGIISKSTPKLINLEEVEPSIKAEFRNNMLEINLAKYVKYIFCNCPTKNNISDYLKSRVPKEYLIGDNIKVRKLTEQINSFYDGIYELHAWRLQKVFTGYNTKMLDICLLTNFLGITVDEIINVQCKETNNCSIKSTNTRISVSKTKNWNEIDNNTLPMVRQLIIDSKLQEKPVRITVGLVERKLNLPSKSLIKMQNCMEEIQNNKETQDEFWIRKINWAVQKIEKSNCTVNWKRIRELTNIKKSDFDRLKINI